MYILGTTTLTDRKWNTEVFRRAVVAGGEVVLPAGVIELHADPSITELSDQGFLVAACARTDRDLTIRGAGMDATILRVREALPGIASLLYVDAYMQRPSVRLQDLTLEGPATPLPAGTTINGVKVQGSTNPGDYTLRLERVRTRGEWSFAIIGSEGDGLLDLDACDVAGIDPAIGWFSNLNWNCRFHARDTSVRAVRGRPGQGSVCVYLSPNVSFLLVGDMFADADRYGLYCNGTSTVPARYGIVSGCHFGPSLGYGIQGQHNGPIEIHGCHIEVSSGRCVSYGGDTVISGCTLIGAADAAGLVSPYGDVAGAQVDVTGCRMHNAGVVAMDGASVRVSGGSMHLDNADFIGASLHGDGSVLRVSGVEFTSNVVGAAACGSAQQAGLRGHVSDCTFGTGVTGLRFTVGSVGQGIPIWRLDRNEFLSTTCPSIVVNSNPPVTDVSVEGRDNIFAPGAWVHAYSAAHRSRLALRREPAVGPVTAGQDVVLSPSYDRYRLGGVAEIQNLFLIGSHPTQLAQFCGDVTLQIDGEISFAAGGNIVPLHTDLRAVGELVRLQLADSVWREL